MAIIDNRTQITNADSTTNWVDLVGTAAGSQNTETYIEGSASVSDKISSTQSGLLYDMGSAQNWSNNHFYIWWNCSTAGKLNTEANGGVAIRFCGSTISDYFEVNVAGSDTYSGGFRMSVIDIETARSSPSEQSISPPATSAIRYIGVVFDVTGMISGNVDNCFVDAMWRLPSNTPGIKVEGQNTGPTDWTWQDIVNAADAGDTTKAWGTAFRRDGVVFINTPIRFGANDAVTHGFSDTSEVVAWEDQLVASDFYGIEVVGGSGTQSFTLGKRVGTGDASVGSEGCVFTAESSGARYYITASDSNIDQAEFFGCTFLHGATFDISNANTEMRSSLISDTTALTHADAGGDGIYQKNNVVNANTTAGSAFLSTDNLAAIKNSSFVFSAGHAIEVTTSGTFSFVGNTFTSYGNDETTSAAIYNSSLGLVTINVSGGGGTPSFRNVDFETSAVKSYNANTTTYTDESTDINNATANDVALPPIQTTTAGDAIYFGHSSQFSAVSLNVGTAGVYSDITLNWEYYNGSAWTSLTVTDNTSGFTQTGHNAISFTAPGDWATTAVDGTTKYWIRARTTFGASPSITTAPLGTEGGVGAVIVNNTVTIKITGVTEGARCLIEKASDGTVYLSAEADSTGTASTTLNHPGGDITVNAKARLVGFLPFSITAVWSNGQDLTINAVWQPDTISDRIQT